MMSATEGPQLEKRDLALPEDIWLARGAVALVILLQLLVVNDLAIGPRWLAPTLELALLVSLSFATAWHQRNARAVANEDHAWRLERRRKQIRFAALFLTFVLTLVNLGQLLGLIRALVGGTGTDAKSLLLDALNIWATNVIVFALWYWGLDQGGLRSPHGDADFIFIQEQASSVDAYEDWSPGFIDYLFLAYTNATAFSPSDTFPLTHRAKLMMMLESGISFLTVGVVAARAVGIIAA